MKILIFLHSLSAGGAERVTANLANHWARQGTPVSVITLAAIAQDFYPLDSRIQRHALQLDQPSKNVGQAVWHNIQRMRALRKLIKATRPDVAIAMMGSSNVLLGLAALGLPGVATIAAERIHPPRLPLGRAWEMLRHLIYGHMSAVVALTSESAAWLRNNTKAKAVHIIPNAAPEHIWQPAPAAMRDTAAQFTLLAAGRLCEQKGFDLLIQAFSTIASSNPQWQLVIAGEGPDHHKLQTLITHGGMTDRIHLTGLQRDMHRCYREADIFVLSSRFEGFPNVLLEAMSYSLPVVSFDCETGPRDIVSHGHNGLLVPTGNTEALANALQQLMQNPQLRQQFGTEAAKITETFSPQRVFDQWQALLDEVTQ